MIMSKKSKKKKSDIRGQQKPPVIGQQRRLLPALLVIAVFALWGDSGTKEYGRSSSSSTSFGFFVTALTSAPDGPKSAKRGKELFAQQNYEQAAIELWQAVLFHSDTPTYDVTEVFTMFMQCYIQQNKLADGLAFVASESYHRGQTDMGYNYLQQALEADPNNELALSIQEKFTNPLNDMMETLKSPTTTTSETPSNKKNKNKKPKQQRNADLKGKSPEDLYEMAATAFANKQYEVCADLAELSCIVSKYTLGPSCANAVYCRNLITDYGFNGTQFNLDMQRITLLTQSEVQLYRQGELPIDNNNNNNNNNTNTASSSFEWHRVASTHPHMTLGYPIDPILKRYVTESVAFLDEKMARVALLHHKNNDNNDNDSKNNNHQIPPLPSDLPYDINAMRNAVLQERSDNNTMRIRVGFVGSGFNSKAVLYLSQDMFRFFNRSQYEIHIFSFGPPDHAQFITHGMRGVDWRKRVQRNVEYFHDCQEMKFNDNHIAAARYIHKQNIHILIEWDGYARQGERAQGLFALRPAPIQILHQEYLGTSGALYVDYLFTDAIVSPPHLEYLYTEKLIRLPNHFFSKGHAYQTEVKQPTYEYTPATNPYTLGTGSPSENRCLSPKNVGPKHVSVVYCNFNKLLKANPETIRSWIRILREVPDSILCLLENPASAIPYFRKFVHETAGTSVNDSDVTTFVPGDGDALNDRIHFLPWENNPFDYQMRNQDMCHIMLDSYPYNGHTVAQDALYAGVPIVTRSDGNDMSSRVTTSGNIILGLEALNAVKGPTHYEEIAIELGTNRTWYQQLRTQLIDTCLQRNPMHRYWDVARYVKNFERGLQMAWNTFIEGNEPNHITVEESELAAAGTYDEEINAHPSDGPLKK